MFQVFNNFIIDLSIFGVLYNLFLVRFLDVRNPLGDFVPDF